MKKKRGRWRSQRPLFFLTKTNNLKNE
jgi:hypothetical protein